MTIGALCAIIFLTLLLVGMLRSRVVAGVATNPIALAAVNADMVQFAEMLPGTARDIKYFSMPLRGVFDARFGITEKPFLDWARERGWSPREITKPVSFDMNAPEGDVEVTITNGYYLSLSSGEVATKRRYVLVAYDRTTGTGFIEYSAGD